MSEKLTVVNVGNIEGRGYLNRADLEAYGIDEFDFVLIENEYEDFGALQVLVSEEIEVGTIAVDSGILDSANISDGDEITIQKAAVAEALRTLTLGIEPLEGQAVEECLIFIAENYDQFTAQLRNRPMFKGLAINWDEAECGRLKVHFQNSEPALQELQIGVVDPSGREVELDIVPSTEMAFNAVLVLDVSGSMTKVDMEVRNIAGALEGLKKGLESTPELDNILTSFNEGEKVSRINATALATMLFLSLKMSKGWGEQIQVISFAGEVDKFIPEGRDNPVISTVGELKHEGIESIVDYVAKRCSEGSGMTFLSGAIKEAYESIEQFILQEGRTKNPTMIVCLTDGAPNKGNGVGLNPIPIVKEYASKYPECVLYTIGLGEADHLLLKKMAELGRGSFFAANDLGELWQYYDTLAQSFQMAIRTKGSE